MIRKAVLEDIPAVLQLIGDNSEHLEPRTTAQLTNALACLWVAEVESQIVGCALLDVYSERIAEIRSVAVKKGFREQGIARELIKAAATEAQNRNIKEVFALTSSTAIFEKLGFANSTRSKYAMFLKKE